MAKKDKPIQWDDIEGDYRSGKMSIREIARWYGVTEAAIRKRAKRDGWERKASTIRQERQVVSVEAISKADSLPDRGREIAGRLMNELDAVTSLHGELEDMICAEESDPRRRQALLKAISLPERAKTLKDISATLKTLAETAAPEGKKAQRQANAEKSASGGKFAAPSGPPKLVVSNR